MAWNWRSSIPKKRRCGCAGTFGRGAARGALLEHVLVLEAHAAVVGVRGAARGRVPGRREELDQVEREVGEEGGGAERVPARVGAALEMSMVLLLLAVIK